MKRSFVCMFIVALSTIILLDSCSSASGLSASRQRKDLKVRGLETISEFDGTKKVLAADSLYPNPDLTNGKVRTMRQVRRDYVLTNGLTKFPLYLYQPADSGGIKWGVKIVNESGDLKIESPIADYDAATSKAGRSTPYTKRSRGRAMAGPNGTIDIYGSVVKAVRTGDDRIAGYTPYLVSFFLNVEEPMQFVHYSYNNVDSKIYNLDDPNQFQNLGDKIYSREINLRYGDRFGLQTMDGRLINLSPQTEALTLEGVDLVLSGPNGNYLFKIKDAGSPSFSSESGDVNYKSMIDGNMPFKRARSSDLSKYTEGYLVVPVKTIACDDYLLYSDLVRTGAIGLNRDGSLQKNVVMSPTYLNSRNPQLYERYKHTLRNPE